MKILFIQTGGSIDKDYPRRTKGWAFEIGEAAAGRILERLDPSFDCEVITCCRKDSQKISGRDREALAELIMNHPCYRIIITHGTDTMLETARYLDTSISDKVVVITGAMRPERFSDSDADINLGTAIGAVQMLKTGIYISMHGLVRPFAEMNRDMETGKFH